MHVPSFSVAYTQQLQNLLLNVGSNGWTEVAAVDVSNSYVAIKLWMMLARQSGHHRRSKIQADGASETEVIEHVLVDDDDEERWVWNEVWHPFEKLVLASMPISADDANISVSSYCNHVFLCALNLGSNPANYNDGLGIICRPTSVPAPISICRRSRVWCHSYSITQRTCQSCTPRCERE